MKIGSQQSKVEEDFLIKSEYVIGTKVGAGCFGDVYKVTNKKGILTVLKVQQKTAADQQTLQTQYKILTKLQGIKGIPQLYNFQYTDKYVYLELELLQNDIQKYLKGTRQFTHPQICFIALELLSVLEEMHTRKIIHRDLKPENIMVKQGSVYIIDFGISIDFSKPKNKKLPQKFVGTPRFASINAHLRKPQRAADDIESLLYLLIYIQKKTLPWMGLKVNGQQKMKAITEIKINKPKRLLCKDLPPCYELSFKHIEESATKTLNYQYLKDLFKPEIILQRMPSLNAVSQKQQRVSKIFLNHENSSLDVFQLVSQILSYNSENMSTSDTENEGTLCQKFKQEYKISAKNQELLFKNSFKIIQSGI